MIVVLFTDARFDNSSELRSQSGLIVDMANGKGRCNLLHYSSSQRWRVSPSIMAEELLALVLGFYQSFVVPNFVAAILAWEVGIES